MNVIGGLTRLHRLVDDLVGVRRLLGHGVGRSLYTSRSRRGTTRGYLVLTTLVLLVASYEASASAPSPTSVPRPLTPARPSRPLSPP